MRTLRFRWAGLFLILLCLSLMAPILPAQEEEAAAAEAAFQTPQDVVLVWAKWASLITTLMAMALILFVLIFRRHRLMEHQSKCSCSCDSACCRFRWCF